LILINKFHESVPEPTPPSHAPNEREMQYCFLSGPVNCIKKFSKKKRYMIKKSNG
jgi:hypothetical protein